MSQTKAQLLDGKSATIQFTGGSASAPSVSFTGDTNTGIYSPGADQVAISTNGTGRLFVDASGRVGVGTLNSGSSQTKLQVNTGGTASDGLGIYGDFTSQGAEQGAISFYGSAFANAALASVVCIDNRSSGGDSRAGSLTFKTSTGGTLSERLRITSAGLVGIGTSSPSNLFHVSGTAGTPAVFERTSATGTFIALKDSASQTFIGNTNGVFSIQTPGSSYSDKLVVTSAGNVGIGTTTPSANLEVFGAANVTDNTVTLRQAPGGTVGYFGTSTNHPLGFRTNNNVALTIDTSQRVGIGSNAPSGQLDVAGSLGTFRVGTSGAEVFFTRNENNDLRANGGSSAALSLGGQSYVRFQTGSGFSEVGRWDSSGRLLVGTSTSRSINGLQHVFQIEGTTTAGSSLSVMNNTNDQNPPFLTLGKSKGGALGSVASVAADTGLGAIAFMGADGTNLLEAATIKCFVDGTPGTNDMPTRLVFSTTADGAASPTERFRIQANGNFNMYSNYDTLYLNNANAAGTTYWHIYATRSATGNPLSGTQSFGVYNNGNVINTNNSYAGISDIKLKENIVDAGSQWSDLKNLTIRKFNFKEGETHTQIGLIAQEAELVSPGLVFETQDRDEDGNNLGTVTKSVNYSVLYMKAVKALQEAMERIEQLETSNADLLARVTALESA